MANQLILISSIIVAILITFALGETDDATANHVSTHPTLCKQVATVGGGTLDYYPVTIEITKITQDEQVSAKGSGNTSPDGSGVGTDTAKIRAERNGNGRVYEISFTANDGNGGECSGFVKVDVPHSKKSKSIDDGQNYDSTAH